ncbi:hypothetical protein [Paraoerskovia marina]|uniref:hypothetical protein n=1 Tax=Paraoerskovia marina TaxID=545619 RepID=UPI0012DC67E1|nr:hypothetical protein [Paraoerskovia marina]
MEFDYATYDTVLELDQASDATVVVTIGKSVGTDLDDGGEPEVDDGGSAVGTPMRFYDARVDEVIRGEIPPEIVVAWLDTDRIESSEPLSAIEPGQQLVRWLDHLEPGDAPGIEIVSDFWVPVSGDNGVMDYSGSKATARSSELTGLTDSDVGGDALEATLDELVSADQ